LATYIGWLMHKTWGGIVAGGLFVLPSLFILIALSWIYVAFGTVPAVAGILYGIKPAVTAIVVFAAYRIGSRALEKGRVVEHRCGGIHRHIRAQAAVSANRDCRGRHRLYRRTHRAGQIRDRRTRRRGPTFRRSHHRRSHADTGARAIFLAAFPECAAGR